MADALVSMQVAAATSTASTLQSSAPPSRGGQPQDSTPTRHRSRGSIRVPASRAVPGPTPGACTIRSPESSTTSASGAVRYPEAFLGGEERLGG